MLATVAFSSAPAATLGAALAGEGCATPTRCTSVAAGGIFMRDVLPIEKVLLLYEPFAAALPYERLV